MDEWKDDISRDRAFIPEPTRIYKVKVEICLLLDLFLRWIQDIQEDIIELLVNYPTAYQFFSTRFPTSTLQNLPSRAYKWRFVTPSQLRVRHFPARYICSNPRCGLTYTSGEVTDNLRCIDKSCNRPLQQITRIYRCPQCNAITEPPIPKICINPNCIRQKLDKDQKEMPTLKWNLRISCKKVYKRSESRPTSRFLQGYENSSEP